MMEFQPAPVPFAVLYLVDRTRNFSDLSVLDMAALLSRPLDEIEGGLLTTIENHAIALTVDDFLMALNSPNGAKRTKLP